jgi:hypothetical protein
VQLGWLGSRSTPNRRCGWAGSGWARREGFH